MNPWRSLRELPRGVWIMCAAMLEQFGPQVLWRATFVSGCLSALLMSRVQETEGGR